MIEIVDDHGAFGFSAGQDVVWREYGIAFDASGALYIAQGGAIGVLRSEDQGATFAPFDGGLENAGNVTRLAYAAGSPARLLLATSTGAFARDLAAACPWDFDGGGGVGITDFLVLLGAWGPNPGHPADFDGDGIVGITDFLELLAHWGPCP